METWSSGAGGNSPVISVPGYFLFPDFTFPEAGPLFSPLFQIIENSDHEREFILAQHRLRKHLAREHLEGSQSVEKRSPLC